MTELPPDFNPETAPPRLEIDWYPYLPFFEDEDISEDYKREQIEALRSIITRKNVLRLGLGGRLAYSRAKGL